jgi:Fe-S-cluster-containing hydrogenase component 2
VRPNHKKTMFIENKTTLIRREIMELLARFYFEDRVSRAIDTIPLRIIPRDARPIRCCIYKDREIIRLRTIATLGISLEQELESDTLHLSDYADIALGRSRPEFPILTFISEACKACVRANYMVTNMCHNCVAQPCMVSCPKGAIFRAGEQAQIDPAKCVNCGICLNACPFHAIVYVPVPCEESCPVNAISKDEQGKEVIDYTKCIFCGRCTRACPFGAIMDKSQIVDVLVRIQRGDPVVAMIAPSIVGQFTASMPQLVHALRALGFTHVVEVALGADRTAEVEECPPDGVPDLSPATPVGRGFPVHGGVADAIIAGVKGAVDVVPVYIDGLTRQNVKLLNAYAKKCPGNLIEVMSCEGGCVGGPGVVSQPQKAARQIAAFTKATPDTQDK